MGSTRPRESKKNPAQDTTRSPKASLEIYTERLVGRECYYHNSKTDEIIGPVTLWIVRELIDAGVLLLETPVKLEKNDPWSYFVELETKLFTKSEYEAVFGHFVLNRTPGYYYFAQCGVQGPIFLNEIHEKILAGELQPDVLICKVGTEDWKAIAGEQQA